LKPTKGPWPENNSDLGNVHGSILFLGIKVFMMAKNNKNEKQK